MWYMKRRIASQNLITDYILYNDEKSNIKSLRAGVPQGFVLGPPPVLLYINDIT